MNSNSSIVTTSSSNQFLLGYSWPLMVYFFRVFEFISVKLFMIVLYLFNGYRICSYSLYFISDIDDLSLYFFFLYFSVLLEIYHFNMNFQGNTFLFHWFSLSFSYFQFHWFLLIYFFTFGFIFFSSLLR